MLDTTAASVVEEANASGTEEDGTLDVETGTVLELERDAMLLEVGVLGAEEAFVFDVLCCDDCDSVTVGLALSIIDPDDKLGNEAELSCRKERCLSLGAALPSAGEVVRYRHSRN